MFDFLLQLIDGGIEYRNILLYVAMYVFALWFLFSLWVFFDAKKRYKKGSWAPLGLFIAVLILNFPALIFYLIIRPEDEFVDYSLMHPLHSVVTVPVAHFTDNNGNVKFSINIDVNKTLMEEATFNFKFDEHPEAIRIDKQEINHREASLDNADSVNVIDKVKKPFVALKESFSRGIDGIRGYVSGFEGENVDKNEQTNTVEEIKKDEISK